MADNPSTGKEEAEEEEEQEGKATVGATGSASQYASKAGSDSAPQNGTPANSHHPSATHTTQPASPVPAGNLSQYESGTDSPLPSNEASKNVNTRTVFLGDEKRSLSPTPAQIVSKSVSQSSARSVSESKEIRGMTRSMSGSPSQSGEAIIAAQNLKTPTQSGTTGTIIAVSSRNTPSGGLSDITHKNIEPQSLPKTPSIQNAIEAPSKHEDSLAGSAHGMTPHQSSASASKRLITSKGTLKDKSIKVVRQSPSAPQAAGFGSCRLFERRSPFVHNPPLPEERRSRISHPQCPRDYIINLREDLADFQESHGLPRTRDYSFLSLGLSLAQETGRAIYAVFLMITELFPVIAIVSLILRFSLDKVIEILETDGTVPRVKKSVIFTFQLLIIMIPLWILVGTIIIPLSYLILTIFRRLFRISGHKRGKAKTMARPVPPHPPVKVKK